MDLRFKTGAIAAALILISVPAAAFAATLRAAEQVSLPAGETIADDLYLSGGTAMMSGTVQGDLSAVGGTVLVSGPVTGDVNAGGGTVTISGTVGDDVHVGGGTVIVQSAVVGDVVAGGGQITIGGMGIGGDVVVGGGAVHIEAPVGKSVRAGGGEVYINAPVAGDVIIKADKVTLGPKAVIAGSLTYTAAQAATLEDGAVVQGETVFTPRKADMQLSPGAIAGIGFAAVLVNFLILFVGAVVFAYLFRRYMNEMVRRATTSPLRQLGLGTIFFIVTPIASIVLLVSIIGLPFGLLGLIAFAAVLIVSCLIAPILLGSVAYRYLSRTHEYEISWRTILLGVVLHMIIGWIPVIGWIGKLVLVLVTAGAIISIKAQVAREWR